MNLGAFSVSLAVKDIVKSKKFYEDLGFSVFQGVEEQGWLILKNENVVIGLFQGMFEKNIFTFNPGWDNSANNLENFTDVREIQKNLLDKGYQVQKEIGDKGSGPAHFVIEDPDGNQILFDQHRKVLEFFIKVSYIKKLIYSNLIFGS